MENQDYKNKNIERKYLENIRNNQFLRVKVFQNQKKDFTELKEIELKDRKIKNKKEIEKLFIKPIILSKDDTNKFEKHEMKKIRPIIRKWFYRLINKNVLGKKPIIKPEIIRDKLRNKLIRDIWKLLVAEKEKEERKTKQNEKEERNNKEAK